MSDEPLIRLAKAAGLSIDWVDADNRHQRVSPSVLRAVLCGLGLEADSDEAIERSLEKLHLSNGQASLPPLLTLDQGEPLDLARHFQPGTPFTLDFEEGGGQVGVLDDQGLLPAIHAPGYHRLRIGERTLTLAVAPPSVPSLAQVAGEAVWGLSLQLYGLRRPGGGGLGDTQALEVFARKAAGRGADALAISPVHAMFSAKLDQYSPYSPSSRLYYNVLYAAPGSILGEQPLRLAIEACGLEQEWQRLEQLELIDWPAVARARLRLLRALFEDFNTGGNAQQQDFDSFRQAAGDALENHCRFEALHAKLLDASGQTQHWRDWPAAYRDPQSSSVRRFAEQHADEVSFHAFCQWLVVRGLERAQNAACGAGMGIGLITDLAVGADGGGSQAWARQAELLNTLTVGAPPDILNRTGQSWGISAFSPWGLKENGYRAFIEMLRANLAHAGGMRIDHVMGLQRLWVIPPGAAPHEGAYLNYPLTDLLRLLTLEAWRHKAVILGEDLGTVPAGLREKLSERGILGMRVLLFEHDRQGCFTPAKQWPRQALATSSTHDLPTLRGWWQGQDINWQARLGQLSEEARQVQLANRAREREGLAAALRQDAAEGAGRPQDVDELLDATVGFLAHTPASLVLLPIEDALGLAEQANMPGTVDTHPNWRRRYPGDSANLLDDPRVSRRLQRLAKARGLSPGSDDR